MGTRNSRNERKPRNSQGGRTGVRPQRATEAERVARIDVVFGLLVSGSRRAEICQFASNTWGIDDRQVDRYIAEATALIKQEAAKAREELFAEHLAFRRHVRKHALSEQDWRAALAAAADEAKLLGLYPSEKHELTGAGGGAIEIEDLDAIRKLRWERAAHALAATQEDAQPKEESNA